MAEHEAPLKTRQEEIADIWKENIWLYAVGGFLAGVLFFPLLQLAITDITGLLSDLVPEAVGIGFTVVFIAVLYRRNEEKRRIKDLRDQLVREASSTSNEFAKNAVHQLRRYGWLTGDDGLLKGMDLMCANLKGTSLYEANLKGTNLGFANLTGAVLREANLEGACLMDAYLEEALVDFANLKGARLQDAYLQDADLGFANLEEADLVGAKLKEAILNKANLERAYLDSAYLTGADLENANLKGVSLMNAKFDENTTLPDGRQWTPSTDMRRFTDPQHPNFWRGYEVMQNKANMQGANLVGVNLQRADLMDADLKGANLSEADLEGADLMDANLEGTCLVHVQFDENTKLPDLSRWTPETDMRRFTDRNHPDFWRSDDEESPAYRSR